MAHHRTVIRQAVVALLTAGGTLAGPRVHDHPTDPRRAFPALTLFDAEEAQRPMSLPAGAGRPVERLYTLDITAEVQEVDGYAATRDSLLAEVEALLATAGAIPGVKVISPAGYLPGQYTEGERPICVGRQRFEILYYTPQGAPATTL